MNLQIIKKNGLALLFLLPLILKTSAQNNLYDVNSIPESVKKNASVVVRNETIEFEVTDIDRAKLNVHRIVTVINESGEEALFFHQQTDKFVSLEDAEIKIYNNAGKIINKYKQKDLNTVSVGDELIDDAKSYYFHVPATIFPVTIEYSYTKRYKGILSYPRYEILVPDEGVESSSYTAKILSSLDVRFKEKNIHLPPFISEDGKYKIYAWSVKNLAPIKYEEGAVSYESRYPSIILAPNHFKLDDYEGDMTSWNSFGLWYASLKKGADMLPEERKKFYSELVRTAKNDREKVKIIYDYLQKNFRYVSIQLGIGGFRPFSAQFTDEKKYGDCKALSNYMQAVLASLGIESYQALINAEYNKEPVDPAFPCNLFNHVILCVPQKKDSIWLECTSRTNDFGELGSFTENRNALLIKENGGILVATPISKASDNIFNAFTTITLKEDGSGSSKTTLKGKGEYKQDLISLMDEKEDEQKNYIVSRWSFKDPDSIIFNKKEPAGEPELIITQELENIPEFKTSSKMFLPPHIYNIWSIKLPKSENRRQDFYFNCPFEKTDTTVFKIPDGYKLEALPEGRNSQYNSACYTSKYCYDEKSWSVYSTDKIILKKNKIPVQDYSAIKNFFDDVLKENADRIVIKKE